MATNGKAQPLTYTRATTADVLDAVRSLSTAFANAIKARDDYLSTEFQNLKSLFSDQVTRSDLQREFSRVLEDSDHKQALTWLVSEKRQKAYKIIHTTLYRSREFGTGSWFTNGGIFQDWQEQSNSCLWLQGPGKIVFHGRCEFTNMTKVGCGKSVLW